MKTRADAADTEAETKTEKSHELSELNSFYLERVAYPERHRTKMFIGEL